MDVIDLLFMLLVTAILMMLVVVGALCWASHQIDLITRQTYPGVNPDIDASVAAPPKAP